MRKMLLGVETEYAAGIATDAGAASSVLEASDFAGRFMAATRRRLTCLPDGSGGVFLANGARLYVDCGMHPEYATPECSSPWEVVQHIAAGDRILSHLAEDLEPGYRHLGELVLHKCNVDYSGAGTTWGCHESYLARRPPGELAAALVPHLASRVIYTGAGGFNPLNPGLEFLLSPRAVHLHHVCSGDSTRGRGIMHLRDERLNGRGYTRIHVIAGESLCSHLGMWLKAGATSLVVALGDEGIDPGDAVRLCNPVEAMQAFSRDPSLRATASVANGRESSALDIQRRYLDLAEAHAGGGLLPEWAGEVCAVWRRVLDQLSADPEQLAASLDWPLKLALYRRRCQQQRIDWKRLPVWTRAAALWGGVPRFLSVRRALFQTDTVFSRLVRGGIFTELDEAGVLNHRVAGVGAAETAAEYPPGYGRARLRGEAVRLLAPLGAGARADWSCVIDQAGRRVLDLNDPFAEEAVWRGVPLPEHRAPVVRPIRETIAPVAAESPESRLLRELVDSVRQQIRR
jgi:proteasome accessory factor A